MKKILAIIMIMGILLTSGCKKASILMLPVGGKQQEAVTPTIPPRTEEPGEPGEEVEPKTKIAISQELKMTNDWTILGDYDFEIIQKLLPKINGYYEDYKLLFQKLISICDENSLKMTKEALISMEVFQRQNMGYCQYLV